MTAAEASSQPVLLEHLASGVLTLTLNRPERLNAFNAALVEALAASVRRAAADEECRVVLLTGAGRGFSAGADLSEGSVSPAAAPPDLGYSLDTRFNPLVRTLRRLP